MNSPETIFESTEFQAFAEEYELLKIDGYDKCAVCITAHDFNPQIVYSSAMILQQLIADDGMDPVEALEYYEYNIVSGLPNKANAPVILLDY